MAKQVQAWYPLPKDESAIAQFEGIVQDFASLGSMRACDIERLQAPRSRIDEELAAARKRLEAADTLIVEFNPIVDPSLIEPVHGRRPRVGKVKAVIDQVLQEAAPRALPTPEIAFEVKAMP